MSFLTHLFALVAVMVLPAHLAERASPVEEFAGSTPCDAEPRRFLGIPRSAACERITWQLSLSSDTPRPAFRLRITYGMQARNDPGFEGGGTALTLTGTSARTAGVYRLISDSQRQSIAFRRVGDDLLHLLNGRGHLVVGNGGWSYTLNRADAAPRQAAVTLEPVPVAVPGAAGVFEGRTPCRALAGRLGAFEIDSGCMKLKWKVTLEADAATRMPARYIVEGTAYRKAPRTGTWTVLRSRQDPKTIVYRLDPDQPERTLSFFKADDNILLFVDDEGRFLIGDSAFSYTLNRVRPATSSARR